jgi:transcriptional regulator with XRE-family HTH domain
MMTGAQLKSWRQERGWKQSDLMVELEIGSRQTITTWETSNEIPRLVELAIVALDQIEACNRVGRPKLQLSPDDISKNRRISAATNDEYLRAVIHVEK